MTIGKRIKNKREQIGIAQVELARKIGCTKQTIYKYENDIVTNIPSDNIEKLAEALNTTPAYLMGWDNDQPSKEIDYSSIPGIMPLPYSSGKTVPLIGDIACGTPILADENIEKQIKLPDNISADLCLRCKGDSMINAGINEDDLLLIRKQSDVDSGDIGIVNVNGDEETLKRIIKKDGAVILQPENPKYDTKIYMGKELDTIHIQGRLMQVVKRF